MVWRKSFIGMLLLGLLAVAACKQKPQVPEPAVAEHGRSVEGPSQVPEPVEGPSPQLSAIDSLLWHQPDSALACLLPYFDTCCRDALNASPTMNASRENATDSITRRNHCVSTTFDRHYANLLLSELLYKNDYAQVNRAELLQAVAYFDSLLLDGADTRGVSLQSRPRKDARHASAQKIAFLDARAHYINGVGYYENDSLVPACAEYLKTLEVMENHFEEKSLVGHKARFMALTYGRLGDIFSEQFMMESSIMCYEHALFYCRIEPTSPTGVSNLLTRLGAQYDKLGDKEKMRDYYEQAIMEIPSSDNLSYRDLVTSKALGDYQLGIEADQSLNAVRQILVQADDDNEKLARFMVMGAIFAEERMYDSAMYYLEPIIENEGDIAIKIPVAECLRIVYDSVGDSEKLNQCLQFLALKKRTESQNKVLVSRLEDLFKDYQDCKQKKQAEEERKKSIGETIGIIVPIAILVALVIYIQIKLRGKKLLKQQQVEAENVLKENNRQHEEELRLRQIETKMQLEETERKHKQKMEEITKRHEEELREQKDRSEKEIEKTKKRHEEELDAERIAYQKGQEVLHRVLREREEQVDALEKALNQQREEAELRREAFLKEAICCKINDSVRSLYITAREGSRKNVTLTKEDSDALRDAVQRHYENFESFLLSKNPKMNKDDIQLCQLYLLGLDERQIAVLQCKTYSAIKKRAAVLKGSMGIVESLSAYILKFSTFVEAS